MFVIYRQKNKHKVISYQSVCMCAARVLYVRFVATNIIFAITFDNLIFFVNCTSINDNLFYIHDFFCLKGTVPRLYLLFLLSFSCQNKSYAHEIWFLWSLSCYLANFFIESWPIRIEEWFWTVFTKRASKNSSKDNSWGELCGKTFNIYHFPL